MRKAQRRSKPSRTRGGAMADNSKIEWTPRSNPITGRPGPAPKPPRDGDRRQARQRVNVEVRTGRRPHPNSIPCVDCGHVWKKGERRHEYDHFAGYSPEHHYSVESVCTTCHARRDSARKKCSYCKRGHAFTHDNTYVKPNGCRLCRECIREKDRTRRNAEWWRAYRLKRKGQRNG